MRRYLIFSVSCLVMLLAAIDSTAVAVAFPTIVSSFDVSLIVAGWIIGAYQLAQTVVLPVAGKISDVLGRKTTFMGFVALFTCGSLLCSLAPNAPSLIVFRVIQGVGGSGFVPSAFAIASKEFPNSRQQAVGLFSAIGPIGWILGPNLGGWMTTVLGWRSIFWINIPLCTAVLIISACLLSKSEATKSHIDLAGSGLLLTALLPFMVVLSIMGGAAGGSPWLLVVVLLCVSAASTVLFWKRTTSIADPVIEPEILRGRPFLAANVYNLVYGCSMAAINLVPLYAVSIYGMSTLESGFILTPRSVGMMATSTVVSFSLTRWGYRRPIIFGTVIAIPAFVVLALELTDVSMLGSQISSATLLLMVMGLIGVAMGAVSPAANNACIELMPDRVGTISSIRAFFRHVGSVVGITVGPMILDTEGIARGFQFYFLGLAALMLLVMPAVFAMPRSPVLASKRRDSAGQPMV